MDYKELADPATRTLVEALLGSEAITARKRWALLQLSVWQEKGWVESLAAAGSYCVTPVGRHYFQHALLELQLHQQPDVELDLQQLALELPPRVHRKVLAAVLRGSRDYRWGDDELATLAAEGTYATLDGLLRIRTQVPFNLFFTQGGLLDAKPQLQLLGEVILPEAALEQLHKVLWTEAPPEQIITIESRAAFVTLQPRAGQLLLLTPPPHTGLAERFISALTPNFTWRHFGDLHPRALARQLHLAERLKRPLHLLLPQELPALAARMGKPLPMDTRWRLAEIPTSLQLSLASLIDQQSWLEHEAMTLFVQDQLSALLP